MSKFAARGIHFWLVTLILVVITVLGIWVSGIFTPWSPVNCWTDSIDINSGRIRHERFFLYRRISDTTDDSPITKALDPAALASVVPAWHPVVTLSPGVHNSPHYAFHGAIAQLNELQMFWEMGHFTPAAKRATAKCLLARWKASGSYFDADRALSGLMDATDQAANAGRSMDVPDLPAEWQ